jgi:hypothetical protein
LLPEKAVMPIALEWTSQLANRVQPGPDWCAAPKQACTAADMRTPWLFGETIKHSLSRQNKVLAALPACRQALCIQPGCPRHFSNFIRCGGRKPNSV